MRQAVDLIPLFKRQFELSNVKSGEVVALLTAPSTWPEYIEAASGAAAALGAHVFEVSVPALGHDAKTVIKGMGQGVVVLHETHPVYVAVVEALKRADFVVDLLRDTVIHLALRPNLLAEGARILTIIEPPDILERMFPSPEIKKDVVALAAKVSAARTLKLTNRAGTDLTYQLNPTGAVPQYGYADVAGKWDQWPSALVAQYPVDGTAHGKLVLEVGDIMFPFKEYVRERVTMTIEEGYIRDIQGGLDAEIIRDYLESWQDPRVYAVSHVGFGVHPRAQWTALQFYHKDDVLGMDARSVRGGFIFSTGPNRYTGRFLEAHLDIPMRGCTVALDDELVLVDGKLMLE